MGVKLYRQQGRQVSRDIFIGNGQGRLFYISVGTTQVQDICRTLCKLAFQGGHSLNIRLNHIPFNDIISAKLGFPGLDDKNQVLYKY